MLPSLVSSILGIAVILYFLFSPCVFTILHWYQASLFVYHSLMKFLSRTVPFARYVVQRLFHALRLGTCDDARDFIFAFHHVVILAHVTMPLLWCCSVVVYSMPVVLPLCILPSSSHTQFTSSRHFDSLIIAHTTIYSSTNFRSLPSQTSVFHLLVGGYWPCDYGVHRLAAVSLAQQHTLRFLCAALCQLLFYHIVVWSLKCA